MRIAIDIDSTLHHYWDQFREVVHRRHGIDLPYEERDWHIEELTPDQLQAAVAETHAEEYVLAAEPYPGAVETIQAWKDAGHFIHITSHRATDSHEVTTQWLDRIGLPHDELYCSYDKVTRCVEIGIDVLIDDSPVNLVRAHDKGILPATIRHPWNREICAERDIVCADDWPGLAERLQPVLQG